MKKVMRNVLVFTLILLPTIMNSVFADPPGPPSPGGTPGSQGGVPVGAPIDNGILILLLLGIVYGAYKIYELRKVKSLEEPSK